MRRFYLHRLDDETGVSGEGIVAEGVQFTDGTVILRWLGPTPSTIIHASMEWMLKVHGHNGKTDVIWKDD